MGEIEREEREERGVRVGKKQGEREKGGSWNGTGQMGELEREEREERESNGKEKGERKWG